MMRSVIAVGMVAVLAACGSDGAGDGGDTLPKRGELASDPTIVSATARCSCGSLVCEGGSPQNSHITLRIAGSDPAGEANLGTCAATIGVASDQGNYNAGTCNADVAAPTGTVCAAGQKHIVDLTVSNDTGGVTTASIEVTVSN